jgi:hypothetical protein
MKTQYMVRAWHEGTQDFIIDEQFEYRFMALKAVKLALKKNLMIQIIKVKKD